MVPKILVVAFVIIMLAAGGYYYLTTPIVAEVPQVPTAQEPRSLAYASSTLGFSISYPERYRVIDSYTYDQFGPKKLIRGVKFAIPMSMAIGTNLSGSDTGVSVEWLPHAKKCTADIYIPANVPSFTLTDAGVQYSIASTSGAGAGNFYEEKVYAIASSTPCTAVRYFIHSTNIGNYEPGSVREFDPVSLLKEFDAIRTSLILNR